MGVFGVDVQERFERNYIPEPMSGCWLWLGKPMKTSGHGRFTYQSKTDYAHRVSYEMYKVPLHSGEVVRHTCDIAYCVNPEHLITGTLSDNIHDMWSRGRAFRQNQTHCKSGHEFSPENTTTSSTRGSRICITCKRKAGREYMQRKRAK